MARRCGVCGFETEDAVCPRCNTILLHGQAICPRCGRLLAGFAATCDACGMSLRSASAADDEETVRLLASIPGISEDQARALAALGFHDVSDLVRLALPDRDVRRGLHHVIARHMLLSDLIPAPSGPGPGDRCSVCGGSTSPGDARCATCGSTLSHGSLVQPVPADAHLDAGPEGMAALADDEDVREMPESIREELLDAFRATGAEDLLREQYRRQVDAWRERGFDVGPIEDLLAKDLNAFRERSVRLIRAQVLARATDGGRCPLCDAGLPVAARMCENCGARVA